MMMFLLFLFGTWKYMPRSGRLFHSCASWFQMSLTLMCPCHAKAQPSLWPLTPSSAPLVLVNDGFPKRGCLNISAMLDGSDLVRPGQMLIHAPRMLFHMDQGALFSLGATNIQLMSGVHGPFPCTSSLVWSAWCLISSFHGSPPGASPLTKSFTNRASNCVLGSMMPRLPLEIGKVRVSHFTLARAGVALPP